MHELIAIPVSERVVRQARHTAIQSQKQIEEILADWLERTIVEMPVETLSDEEILQLCDLQLTAQQQNALSDLLAKNSEGALQTRERFDLDELMRVYEQGLLRKAQALKEAVQRGLREPLQS